MQTHANTSKHTQSHSNTTKATQTNANTHKSLGAKDKQAIQRGAEQTSNSARRGTINQLSEARHIQAFRRVAGQTSNCVFDQSLAFVAQIIYALF